MLFNFQKPVTTTHRHLLLICCTGFTGLSLTVWVYFSNFYDQRQKTHRSNLYYEGLYTVPPFKSSGQESTCWSLTICRRRKRLLVLGVVKPI